MTTTDSRPGRGPLVTIHIDRVAYHVAAGRMTGKALRAVPDPDIPAAKEFFLDVDDAVDQPIGLEQVVEVSDGLHFYSDAPGITIRIDRVEHEVFHRKMTGAELRRVPSPDITADRDLWLDVPDKRDRKIQDEDVVRLHEGQRYFTAPGRINPGANRGASPSTEPGTAHDKHFDDATGEPA